MAEVSVHLCDRVIPQVSVRQWVLSVPKRLRPHLAGDADLAGAVLRILLQVIEGALRESAREAPPDEARLGAVSFLHRFGSGLNPHPHFHLAVTDGLFTQKDAEGLTFHPAVDLDAETARSLTSIVQRPVVTRYQQKVRCSSPPPSGPRGCAPVDPCWGSTS